MNTATKLIVLPPPESIRTVFTTPNGLDPYLQQIRAQLDEFVPDLTTKKGREAIASIAFKVAQGKTALDNLGKGLVEEMKKEPATVDAERKRMRDTMDKWKEEIRQPLTAWEAAEEERIAAHREVLTWLDQIINSNHLGKPADTLRALLADVEALELGVKWEEFADGIAKGKASALVTLNAAITAREIHDAEQAELIRLREQAAAREKQDREDRIARDAADQAKREAEAAAQAERDAAAKREADAKAAAERAELELKQRAEKAEREKQEAEQREQQAKADAERQAAEAVEAEKRRVAAAAEAEAQEARRRERDKAHKTAINRAALDAFMKGGLTEECAKTAITLIAKKAIPAISITY